MSVINQLKQQLVNAWWVVIIISVSLLFFGVFAILLPDIILTVLMTLLAVMVILWGVSQFTRGMQLTDGQAKTFLIVAGGLLVVLGIVMLLNPTVSITTVAFVAGWLVLLRSGLDILLSRVFPTKSRTRALWLLSGVIGICASFLLWFFPTGSARLFVQFLGGYALINGLILFINAIDLRRIVYQTLRQTKTTKPSPQQRDDIIDL